MNLTEHFTLEAFIRSNKARVLSIDNTMLESLHIPAVRTCEGLERSMSVLGRPVVLISGYRCQELNTAVGGSKNSQHMKAEAVDFLCPAFGTSREVALALVAQKNLIRFDQLILERTWVHCSFSLTPRGEVLTLTNTGYAIGIV